MKPQSLILALAATSAIAQDAPCTNEACTSLCNATPSCLSTLFDPRLGLCYTFPCVVNNYSKPSSFLGYQKPGATYECVPEQPVPGIPNQPPPEEPAPPVSEAGPTLAEPAPTEVTSAEKPHGVPTSGTTNVSTRPTASHDDTANDGSGDESDGDNTDTNADGEDPDATDDDSDPAAPTVILPGAAIRLGSSVSVLPALLAGAYLCLF
jgi:hypothetical protein